MTGCALCGRVAEHQHHPTARHRRGPYLDAALVVPLCGRCHSAEHVALRRAGLGETASGCELSLRLGRLGHFVHRLSAQGRGLSLEAGPTAALGTLLAEAAGEQEGRK